MYTPKYAQRLEAYLQGRITPEQWKILCNKPYSTIKENWVMVRYEHRLTEDIGTLKAGTTLHSLETRDKLPFYSAWNGVKFIDIPSEKVTVYQVTTKHTVTEYPV
jgi:hypothetical protein